MRRVSGTRLAGTGRHAVCGLTLRPLILQPDFEPYGANRALLRTLAAMPEGSVRPVVVFPYEGAAFAEAGCDVAIAPTAVLRRSSAGPAGLYRLMQQWASTGTYLAELAKHEACDLVHTNSLTIVRTCSVAALRSREC